MIIKHMDESTATAPEFDGALRLADWGVIRARGADAASFLHSQLTQDIVRELAQQPDLVLICARYEGVDERVSQALCTDEISIGDYVLSGGELPALVVIEAVSRMIPGVIGDYESVETDSFYDGILGAPQYTRPPEFRGMEVPAVLREGNHAAIRQWRRKEALRATKVRRPDLLEKLKDDDQKLIDKLEPEN